MVCVFHVYVSVIARVNIINQAGWTRYTPERTKNHHLVITSISYILHIHAYPESGMGGKRRQAAPNNIDGVFQ